jgi:hypothetical protein
VRAAGHWPKIANVWQAITRHLRVPLYKVGSNGFFWDRPLGLIKSLFGRGASASNPERAFNSGPEFVGAVLLYQFFPESRPLVSDDELETLCRPFIEPMRNHVHLWLITYSAWILKIKADAQYGRDFGRAVMAAVYGRLAANEDRVPQGAGLAEWIKLWFKEFENRFQDADENPMDVERRVVPPVRYTLWLVALTFLVRDTGNPYASRGPDHLDGVDDEVAAAFAKVTELAAPRADFTLERAKNRPR